MILIVLSSDTLFCPNNLLSLPEKLWFCTKLFEFGALFALVSRLVRLCSSIDKLIPKNTQKMFWKLFKMFQNRVKTFMLKIIYSENVVNCLNNLLNGLNLFTIMFDTQDSAFNSTVHSLIHISRGMVDMTVCILALRSSISLLLCYRHALSRRRRRRRLKGIHSRPDTNRTGAEGLSFYYPRLLYCLDQMLAVMLLSQHRVSSSRTVRPRAPCGARCMGHIVSTWYAVCSEAPHSRFGEGARPHLCMDEWNRPTPVRRRLSLTQAARGKPIPTGLALVPGTKARSLEALSQYSAFHL